MGLSGDVERFNADN